MHLSKKAIVLDASVLLHDPDAFYQFKGVEIYLSTVVIDELDRKKNLHDEIGKNARYVMRILHRFLKQKRKEGQVFVLSQDLRINILFFDLKKKVKDFSLMLDRPSNIFLYQIFNLQKQNIKPVLVSKDSVLKIKAEALGIRTQDYRDLTEYFSNLYKGIRYTITHQDEVKTLTTRHALEASNDGFLPNEYSVFRADQKDKGIACRWHSKKNAWTPVLIDSDVWGIEPRNIEQQCALDLLLRDSVKLVTLVGSAGTGKTLLALATALRKVFDEGSYHRVILSRSLIPLGRDLGFLPGTKEEKLHSWLAPYFDNLEYIVSKSRDGGGKDALAWITESEKFQVEAITYMRGRSFANSFVIIDEAQNLTPHELKTIISRVSFNTKIIVIGDPTQIDNPYLDEDSNGLVHLIGKMKQFPIFGHVHFQKSERSELASLASQIL